MRCRRMWPPSACPSANSTPHTAHPCAREAFTAGVPAASESATPASPSPAAAATAAAAPPPPPPRGRLWLARWPPSAWNDGNRRLHVLHSKTRGASPPWPTT
ncbi:hypothetical protein DAI22_03g393000 [Oryza sativa Japonica Group]|nr:hypothetical protein DAI22_03g393000 [Oryza sativa Japonica Group]